MSSMRHVRSVSFAADEQDLIEWADSHAGKGGFSRLVKDLIRKAMKPDDLPGLVARLIDERLKEKSPPQGEEKVTDDHLKGLF